MGAPLQIHQSRLVEELLSHLPMPQVSNNIGMSTDNPPLEKMPKRDSIIRVLMCLGALAGSFLIGCGELWWEGRQFSSSLKLATLVAVGLTCLGFGGATFVSILFPQEKS